MSVVRRAPCVRAPLLGAFGAICLMLHAPAWGDDKRDKAFGMASFVCVDSYAGALDTPHGKAMGEDAEFRDYIKFFKEDFGTCFTKRAWLSDALCDELLRLDLGQPRDDATAKRVTREFRARHEAELEELEALIDCMSEEEAKNWGRRKDK